MNHSDFMACVGTTDWYQCKNYYLMCLYEVNDDNDEL